MSRSATDDLVPVGGVSARSIYHGFQPLPLDHADGLSQGGASRLGARRPRPRASTTAPTSVTEAATAAGYTNLSQFSRDYKARFREAPSRTLADAVTGLHDGPQTVLQRNGEQIGNIERIADRAIFSRNLSSPSPSAMTSRYWLTLNSRVCPSRSVWYTV